MRPNIEKVDGLGKDTDMSTSIAQYLTELKNQDVEFDNEIIAKLVIPSLKGDLVFRMQREICPRPFLKVFMTYLLRSSQDVEMVQSPKKDFFVFLWSTAMPKKLLPILEALFVEWKECIVGVWNQQHL